MIDAEEILDQSLGLLGFPIASIGSKEALINQIAELYKDAMAGRLMGLSYSANYIDLNADKPFYLSASTIGRVNFDLTVGGLKSQALLLEKKREDLADGQ